MIGLWWGKKERRCAHRRWWSLFLCKTDHRLSWCWARSSQPGREEVRTAVSTRKHSLTLPHTHSSESVTSVTRPSLSNPHEQILPLFLTIALVSQHVFFFFIICCLCCRLQDSLEFIGQDSNTLWPDQNTGVNSLLRNIGNTKVPPVSVKFEEFHVAAGRNARVLSFSLLSILPSDVLQNYFVLLPCSVLLEKTRVDVCMYQRCLFDRVFYEWSVVLLVIVSFSTKKKIF